MLSLLWFNAKDADSGKSFTILEMKQNEQNPNKVRHDYVLLLKIEALKTQKMQHPVLHNARTPSTG